jgi:NarL family two-component system response regulator LiaR
MPKAERIKVMIVDDHPIVRSGLVTMLLAFDDLELVGEASSGNKALALCQQVKIIILTSFTKDNMVQDALEAGATSYLLKDSSIDQLAEAIRSAYTGQPTLSPEATRALVNSKSGPQSFEPDLTRREKQVLALIVEGLSNEEIADQLVISHATARHHVSACISKLGVKNRTQAASLAIKHKLI